MFSVFSGGAFTNCLGKQPMPYLTLPFNIITIISFLLFLPNQDHDIPIARDSPTNASPTHNNPTPVSWPGVAQSIMLSMGQVYAVHDIVSSCLISLAVALFSPLMFCMCMVVATMGCIMSIAILPPELYHQVYQGLWGYNPLLSMAAVSCVFITPSASSLLTAMVNTVLTVCMQKAILGTLTQVRDFLEHQKALL